MAREGDAGGKPPADASEYGGHAGMAEDWVPYGHELSAAELARAARREDPDPPVGRQI
jgi:hypothetical protein